MTALSIRADSLSVRFRPYVDRSPTLRRSLGRLRHREQQDVLALDGLSFEVHEGEAFGIIGRNGAGKSTLLRVLAGTLTPNHGSVDVFGHTSTLLQLGVGFNPELSGRRNIYLGGLVNGLRRAEIDGRFDEIVAYSELGDAINRPVKTYSSGMFARLSFAISVHMTPDILFLDEILAVGDQAFQEKSIRSMQDLLDRSGTIVLVTHGLKRIVDFCDRAMWLDEGSIEMIGDADKVVEAYADAVTTAARAH